MNLSNNQPTMRGVGRVFLKDLGEQRRFFGRDITNLDRRTKNASIHERETRAQLGIKSRSLHSKTTLQLISRDPLNLYSEAILAYMLSLQKVEKEESQKDLNDKMRQILIDWLIDVHESFELKQQTLYLALSYLNDYTALRPITKQSYQLVGITCLWIASKYQQIYPPRMKCYVDVTAQTYTIRELKDMESKVIDALQFNLNRTTLLHLLQACTDRLDGRQSSTVKYILQLALLQGKLPKQYDPCTMVAAAVALTDSIYKSKTECRGNLGSKEAILSCFRQMTLLLNGQNKYNLNALKRKFTKDKYHRVAKIVLDLKVLPKID